jgi:hypothetical protein
MSCSKCINGKIIDKYINVACSCISFTWHRCIDCTQSIHDVKSNNGLMK